MRRTLLLSAVLLAAACTCQRSTSSQLAPGGKAKAGAAGTGSGQAPTVLQPDSRSSYAVARPSMVKLARFAREVKARLDLRGPIVAPAKALNAAVAEIPDVPAFTQWKNILGLRTAKLAASKDPRGDFNVVIEACVSCHTRYAPGSLAQLQALQLK